MKVFPGLLLLFSCWMCVLTPAMADDNPTGTGTAFVVSAKGDLLTCAHVVENAVKINILLGGKSYTATVTGADVTHDLALIHITAHDLTSLPLANSDAAEVGQEARAFGFPLTDILGEELKVTRGTISGRVNIEKSGTLFQIDAPVNAGNSGGPLVNEHGEVLGIVNAKMVGEDFTNIGFAVPVNYAKTLLKEHGVSTAATGAEAALDGPTLVKTISPAVALVQVTTAVPLYPYPVCVKKEWGFINTHGAFVIQPAYDAALMFSEGLASVDVDGKWGYINTAGKTVIPCKYDMAFPFMEGMALVNIGGTPTDNNAIQLGIIMKGGVWHFIDKTGRVVLTPHYSVVNPFSESMARILSDEKFGYIHPDGTEAITPTFDNALPFSEGLAGAKSGELWGFIDTTGSFVIKPQYQSVLSFSQGLAPVMSNGQCGFIDKHGREVIPLRYPSVTPFSEGMSAVQFSEKYFGFINTAGTLVVSGRFTMAGPFVEGLAIVQQSKKFGFINKQGEFIVPPRFNHAGSFYGGIAPVRFGKKWGFVNTKGELAIDLQFDDIDASIIFRTD